VKRFSISAEARSDLDGIWNYIAERSSAETATEFLQKFYASFHSIGSSPSVGVAMRRSPWPNLPAGKHADFARKLEDSYTLEELLEADREFRSIRPSPGAVIRVR
jgi:plasmid stabilization system protein ParE